MNNYKIIQIIPTGRELYSKYEDEGEEFTTPIVCFALIEYEDGEREVVPMNIDSVGTIDLLTKNLIEIVDKPII